MSGSLEELSDTGIRPNSLKSKSLSCGELSMPAGKGVALVTGGAKRMGRAFVEALAEDGYSIAIHYNSSSRAADECPHGSGHA